MPNIKLISGGQTGVDRAALDVALESGLACGGWCPASRLAEDGRIPDLYPLTETPSDVYAQRTRWNVRDSDATLILNIGELTGGTALTAECAGELGRPLLIVDLDRLPPMAEVVEWLRSAQVGTLNVAGPRESSGPGSYGRAVAFLRALVEELCRDS